MTVERWGLTICDEGGWVLHEHYVRLAKLARDALLEADMDITLDEYTPSALRKLLLALQEIEQE